MQYRLIGPSGIEASVVGLGAWAIGGWMWGGTDEAESIRAIQAAIDAGITLIDTAPVYGFGRSEHIVGKALRGRRDKVVLATKCGLVWQTDKGMHYFNSDDKHPRPDATDVKVHKYLAPESIRCEVEQSLQRLGTDRIDLYQPHWQEDTTPIADTMGELMNLKAEGKIRAIGVCNATSAQMDEYRRCGVLDSDQERYSMLDRAPDSTALPYCQTNGMAFLAYSPLCKGLLTGKMGPDREFNEGDQRRTRARFSVENRQRVARMLEGFRAVADKHGLTLGQLAIAWTVHQPGCTHALVGARNPQQAFENAKAGSARLSQTDLADMNRVIAEHAANIDEETTVKTDKR